MRQVPIAHVSRGYVMSFHDPGFIVANDTPTFNPDITIRFTMFKLLESHGPIK